MNDLPPTCTAAEGWIGQPEDLGGVPSMFKIYPFHQVVFWIYFRGKSERTVLFTLIHSIQNRLDSWAIIIKQLNFVFHYPFKFIRWNWFILYLWMNSSSLMTFLILCFKILTMTWRKQTNFSWSKWMSRLLYPPLISTLANHLRFLTP